MILKSTRSVLLGILFFTIACSYAGTGQDPVRLRLQVKLTVCYDSSLHVVSHDSLGNEIVDTLFLDRATNSYSEEIHLAYPQKIDIYGMKVAIRKVFVSPGQVLLINADIRDLDEFHSTIRFAGIGSDLSRATSIIEKLTPSWKLKTHPYDSSVRLVFAEHLRLYKLRDSVFTSISKKSNDIVNSRIFLALSKADTRFLVLNYLIGWGQNIGLSNDSILRLLDSSELLNTSSANFEPELLASAEFRSFVVSYYPRLFSDRPQKGRESKPEDHIQEQIAVSKKLYTGKILDYFLYQVLMNELAETESLSLVDTIVTRYQKIYLNFSDPIKSKNLADLVSSRYDLVMSQQAGQIAPEFTGITADGKVVSTKDFAGKIVVLDLWASWCGPCRRETPFLDQLVLKHRSDTSIVFVSIAVFDHRAAWEKAIREDNPKSIQLLDYQDKTVSKFTGPLSIPRFIVIGKAGEIINFNAPLPGDKDELEKISQ